MHAIQFWARLRHWARRITRDLHAVYLASRDPRVPLYAKALALLVAAYALSPIDLIPDFIPVIGYLDDMLILPLGIWLVIRLIPPALMAEFRDAAVQNERLPANRTAAVVIVTLWILVFGFIVWQVLRVFFPATRLIPMTQAAVHYEGFTRAFSLTPLVQLRFGLIGMRWPSYDGRCFGTVGLTDWCLCYA
jgi:uncharacterized membrane protein YkvA (DUF1232 family)